MAEWGTMEWLVEDANHTGANMSLARMTVLSGQTSPAHRHANANEAIHVLSGRMRQRVCDKWIEAGAGDTVFVPAHNTHQTHCISDDPVVMIIAYSAGARDYEELEAL